MTVCSLPPKREKNHVWHSRFSDRSTNPTEYLEITQLDDARRERGERGERGGIKGGGSEGGKREEEEKEEERGYGREAARSDMHTRYVIILSSIASDSTLNFSLAARTKIHPRIRLSKWHGLNGNARIYAYDLDVFSRARCFPDPRREAKHVVWRETANRGDRSFDLIKVWSTMCSLLFVSLSFSLSSFSTRRFNANYIFRALLVFFKIRQL